MFFALLNIILWFSPPVHPAFKPQLPAGQPRNFRGWESTCQAAAHSSKFAKLMKHNTRKQEMDIFCKKLNMNFRRYCAEHRLPEELDNFTAYLIDQELIGDSTIRQYAILELFKELYPENKGRKTQTVELLASRFNLTPRSVWNVLRKWGK